MCVTQTVGVSYCLHLNISRPVDLTSQAGTATTLYTSFKILTDPHRPPHTHTHSSRALRSPTTAYFNLQTLHSFDFLIGVLNTPGSFKAAMTFNLFHSYLTVSVVLVALLYCSLFEQFQFLVSELNPARIHLTGVLLLVLIYHVTHWNVSLLLFCVMWQMTERVLHTQQFQ